MFLGGDNAFELKYASGFDSSKSCNPFGDSIGYLSQVMSLSMIQYLQDRLRLGVIIEFPNNS